MKRSPSALSVVAAIVIALGLACRRPGAPPFVQLYGGDMLWGALFFLLFAWLLPKGSPLRLGLCAIMTTELIELSQLYQAPWALELRATPVGGLLLGHGFLWSDLLCVFVGAAFATLLDVALASMRRSITYRTDAASNLRPLLQRFKASRWWRWRSCSST